MTSLLLLVGDDIGATNSFSWLSLVAIDIVSHGDICEALASFFFFRLNFRLFDFITFFMKVRLATIVDYMVIVILKRAAQNDLKGHFPYSIS